MKPISKHTSKILSSRNMKKTWTTRNDINCLAVFQCHKKHNNYYMYGRGQSLQREDYNIYSAWYLNTFFFKLGQTI